MKTVLLLVLAGSLAGCSGGNTRVPALAGDSLCIGFGDGSAPLASVSGGGITIAIPLFMVKPDAGIVDASHATD